MCGLGLLSRRVGDGKVTGTRKGQGQGYSGADRRGKSMYDPLHSLSTIVHNNTDFKLRERVYFIILYATNENGNVS